MHFLHQSLGIHYCTPVFSFRLEGNVIDGLWNGPMIGFEKWFLTMNMTLIANFDHGLLEGKVWKLLEENGYLVSDNLEMHGNEVLYIYPGFEMGLYGEFYYGKMVSAKPVEISGNINISPTRERIVRNCPELTGIDQN